MFLNRYEDPAAILCPVGSMCVAVFLPYLNRVLGLGDPKMLSPDLWATEVGWAESPQDGCRCRLGPLSWRKPGVVKQNLSNLVGYHLLTDFTL